MAQLSRFTVVDATFKPERTDDLKPGMEQFIGQRAEFTIIWMMDDDDSYPGQWAFEMPEAWGRKVKAVWVPEEDLEIHTIVKEGI